MNLIGLLFFSFLSLRREGSGGNCGGDLGRWIPFRHEIGSGRWGFLSARGFESRAVRWMRMSLWVFWMAWLLVLLRAILYCPQAGGIFEVRCLYVRLLEQVRIR